VQEHRRHHNVRAAHFRGNRNAGILGALQGICAEPGAVWYSIVAESGRFGRTQAIFRRLWWYFLRNSGSLAAELRICGTAEPWGCSSAGVQRCSGSVESWESRWNRSSAPATMASSK
jgi:hypothetical protein